MQPAVGKIAILERRSLLFADLAGSDEVYKSADGGSPGKRGKLRSVYLYFHYNTSGEHFMFLFYTSSLSPVNPFRGELTRLRICLYPEVRYLSAEKTAAFHAASDSANFNTP